MEKIILIIFFICFLGVSNLVFASDDTAQDTLVATGLKMKEDFGPGRNFFDEILQKIDQEVIDPVKQTIENLPQDIEDGLNHLWEELKSKKEQKQEEIKEEIKQEIKQEIQESGQKAERKYLAPLKNRIQRGIDKIREVVNSIKAFIINLF
jgi:hypothetical protein|tara:strand:- start:1301 stop:1753 length:453 start_codon:yes stop_codon:yes gene_type:complete